MLWVVLQIQQQQIASYMKWHIGQWYACRLLMHIKLLLQALWHTAGVLMPARLRLIDDIRPFLIWHLFAADHQWDKAGEQHCCDKWRCCGLRRVPDSHYAVSVICHHQCGSGIWWRLTLFSMHSASNAPIIPQPKQVHDPKDLHRIIAGAMQNNLN